MQYCTSTDKIQSPNVKKILTGKVFEESCLKTSLDLCRQVEKIHPKGLFLEPSGRGLLRSVGPFFKTKKKTRRSKPDIFRWQTSPLRFPLRGTIFWSGLKGRAMALHDVQRNHGNGFFPTDASASNYF